MAEPDLDALQKQVMEQGRQIIDAAIADAVRAATALLPAEDMTLTVARAQLERGDPIAPNTAGMLVMALDRLTGRSDWRDLADAGDGGSDD